MQTENNTIILVRALVKLSGALYDIDCLKESSKYKFQIKKDLDTFQPWLEEYIREPITTLTKADSETLMTLINLFTSYEETVFVKNGFNTCVNLFLAKCHSALNDLKDLDKQHSTYVNKLSVKLENLLSAKYFNQYTDYVDPDGKTFSDIIRFMDDEGKSIIIGTL